VGLVTAIARTDTPALDRLADKLSSCGITPEATPHFVVFRKAGGGMVILHTFSERTVDEDLVGLVANELGELGVLGTAQDFSDAHVHAREAA
jgi:hypothetical protein